ncbi:MAG: glycerate kinase [Acutalibacteraceae bacterium]|jgi:glycerate kinase
MPGFLIVPDSFKGTLNSDEVCGIIGEAILSVIPDAEIKRIPVADGGEGMAEALLAAAGGQRVSAVVTGVFGAPMTAGYVMLSDGSAAMDMSACAGLPLAGNNKNPALATTRGVGELIIDAVGRGAKSIVLGLGGSATNDCGIGMASALGYRFLDNSGREVDPVGASMTSIKKIIPPQKHLGIRITAACDVDNPLFGEQGAAFVFAPQKGADEAMVKELDNGLRNMADLIKRDLGKDAAFLPGSGAAGGMGAGVVAFLDGSLRSGIDLVLDAADFDKYLEKSDYVITGEGRMDAQSMRGKVPAGVARRAAAKGKTVIAVNGSLGAGAQEMLNHGIDAVYAAVTEEKSMEEILRTCREDLFNISVKAIKDLI